MADGHVFNHHRDGHNAAPEKTRHRGRAAATHQDHTLAHGLRNDRTGLLALHSVQESIFGHEAPPAPLSGRHNRGNLPGGCTVRYRRGEAILTRQDSSSGPLALLARTDNYCARGASSCQRHSGVAAPAQSALRHAVYLPVRTERMSWSLLRASSGVRRSMSRSRIMSRSWLSTGSSS